MPETRSRPDRKVTELRSAARYLDDNGEGHEDARLAELLVQVADSYEDFQALDPAPIEEAIRWTPVLYAATRVAREVMS